MDRYLVVRGCSSGDLSLVDKVTRYLRLSVNDVLNNVKVDTLCGNWVTLEDEHLGNLPVADTQLPVIKQFVEMNSKQPTTPAHKYLIAKVREFITTK